MEVCKIGVVIANADRSCTVTRESQDNVLIATHIVGEVIIRDHDIIWGDKRLSHVVEVGVLVRRTDQRTRGAEGIDRKQVVGRMACERRERQVKIRNVPCSTKTYLWKLNWLKKTWLRS